MFLLRSLVKMCEQAVSKASFLCANCFVWCLFTHCYIKASLQLCVTQLWLTTMKKCCKTCHLSCCSPATMRSVKRWIPNGCKPSVLGLVNEGSLQHNCMNSWVVIRCYHREDITCLVFIEYCLRLHLGLWKPDLQIITSTPQSSWHT